MFLDTFFVIKRNYYLERVEYRSNVTQHDEVGVEEEHLRCNQFQFVKFIFEKPPWSCFELFCEHNPLDNR